MFIIRKQLAVTKLDAKMYECQWEMCLSGQQQNYNIHVEGDSVCLFPSRVFLLNGSLMTSWWHPLDFWDKATTNHILMISGCYSILTINVGTLGSQSWSTLGGSTDYPSHCPNTARFILLWCVGEHGFGRREELIYETDITEIVPSPPPPPIKQGKS